MPTTISGNDGVSQVQDGVIVQADLATAILPLGVGQAWVNVTGIRNPSTPYTNDTGRTIAVQLSMISNSAGAFPIATVGGADLYGNTASQAGTYGTIHFEVPANVTYSAVMNTGATTQWRWMELR